MSLKKRLGNLEHARQDEIAAWRDSWQRLMWLVNKHTPEQVLDRTVQALPGDDDLDDKLYERAVDLGISEIHDWLSWEIPDLDKPDFALRPETIPMPPAEPAGVWEILERELQSDELEGDVAVVLLYALGVARAVREYPRGFYR